MQMDPEIDAQLSMHVLQSHMYRKPGEADGAALRMETSTDVIVHEHEVRCERRNTLSSPILLDLLCVLTTHPFFLLLSSFIPFSNLKETPMGETPVYITVNTARGRERLLSVDFVKKYLLFAKARW